jgi:hypothetical protein
VRPVRSDLGNADLGLGGVPTAPLLAASLPHPRSALPESAPPPHPGLVVATGPHVGRATGPHVGRPLRCLSGCGGLLPLGRSRPCAPSSPVPTTSSPTWIPCAPLPCVGIFARAAPCHRASHLLIARGDAPTTPPTSGFSRRRCRQHPLPGPALAPAWLDTPRRPPPSSPSLDPSLPRPSRPDPRCCDLSGSIRRPFGWMVSSRLDPSLPWPSQPDLLFPPSILLRARTP